jgi:hypothetical protein
MANPQGIQFARTPWWKRKSWLAIAGIVIFGGALAAAAIGGHLRSERDVCAGIFEADACRFGAKVGDECERSPDFEKCMDQAGYFDHLTADTQTWVRAMQAGPLRGSHMGPYVAVLFITPPGLYCGELANELSDGAVFKSLVANDGFLDLFHARWWIAETRQRACPQDLRDTDQAVLREADRRRSKPQQQAPRPPPVSAPNPVVVAPQITPPPVMSGADSKGFLDSGGPQCVGTDSAALLLRTSQSRVVVCRSTVGALSYHGVRLSDGAGLVLSNVQGKEDGYTAVNPADGTEYRASLKGLVITQGGQVLGSEDALESAFM